jgi:hypothetical protein
VPLPERDDGWPRRSLRWALLLMFATQCVAAALLLLLLLLLTEAAQHHAGIKIVSR